MLAKPKYKVCRRLGPGIYEKCQTDRYALSDARREARGKRGGKRGRRNASDYGAQLLEKQKMRFTYGVSEGQFRRYVDAAARVRGADTGRTLVAMLESRLDNVVYRLGWAATRRAARQLISHGHITVNGRRTNIASRPVGAGDRVAVRTASVEKPVFARLRESDDARPTPPWAALEGSPFSAALSAPPSGEDAERFDSVAVVEFYSR